MVHGRRKTINIHNAYTYLYTYTHSISYYCDVGRKLLMKTWHLASNQCCFETPVNWCVFTNDRTKRINYSQSQNKIHIPNNKFSLNVTLYHPKYFHPDQYQFISFGVKVCVNLTLFFAFFHMVCDRYKSGYACFTFVLAMLLLFPVGPEGFLTRIN